MLSAAFDRLCDRACQVGHLLALPEDMENGTVTTPDPTSPRNPPGPLSSVLGSRLAITLEGPPPTLDDLGLAAAKEVGFEWQQQRSRSRWNEIVAAVHGHPGADWVPEIHGIVGVIGEQVLLAAEAEVEKHIITDRLNTLQPEQSGSIAAAARSLRFFAEGQANALTVALHGLANLTLRTLVLDPAFDIAHVKAAQVKLPDFVPGSDARRAWCSVTTETRDAFLTAAAAYALPMLALAQRFAGVVDDAAIAELIAFRNVQYHRWRGESPGVTGIDLHAPTARQRLERGESVGLNRELLPSYSEGQQALDDLVRISRSALDALVARMPDYHQSWYAAFQDAVG